MYDSFSGDYDRFVNWQARLAGEMPFIEAQLKLVSARRVLDAACGTGMHAIALAQRGYTTAGCDLSLGMVARARAHAAESGLDIRFEDAGFGELAQTFGPESFDAVLCLGNSLPHALSLASIQQALRDFAACLRPGGLLLVQNRNFDSVLEQQERWMEPQSYHQDDQEWLFLRFYDFEPNGLINFHILTLHRIGEEPWSQRVRSTHLFPLRQQEFAAGLEAAGFGEVAWYGGLSPVAFDPRTSGNLVAAARRSP